MEKTLKIELEILNKEIELCETYNEKFKKWAEFTVDYCNGVARDKIDRCFYAFQSEPKETPEVLILGLNPHGKDNYESMYIKDENGWGLKKEERMTTEVFMHQNPWYVGGRMADKKKEWNILNKMNKTIHVNKEFSKLFDNMVYMNVLYFNSNNFREFQTSFPNHWKEVYENCIELSKILISKIIKPKKIICLGIDNCFKPFIGNEQFEPLIEGDLVKLKKDEFCIYGMTHPSAPGISNIRRENIGWHIYADWFNKPIFTSMSKKVSSIKSILTEIAIKQKLELYFDEKQLANRFGFFKFIPQNENDISLLFEFQKSFYSDLMYGIYENRNFTNGAKKCVSPYDNWFELEENFNQEDFKNYFEKKIETLLQE